MEPLDVISKTKDCFIVHEDRGLQNFVRYNWGHDNFPTIEFVPGEPDCFKNTYESKKRHNGSKRKGAKNPLAALDIIPLTTWGNNTTDLLYWSEVDDDCSELYASTLVVHESLYPAYRSR